MNRLQTNPILHALRLTAMAAIVGVSGCQSPTAADEAAAQDAARAAVNEESRVQILAELESYYLDLSARKWSAFASHFWPGATISTVWNPPGEQRERVHVQTIPEFIAQTPQGADSKSIFSEKLLNAEIHVDGVVAQAWAHYEAEFGEPGSIARWNGTDVFTLMRHGGRWRIVALAFAPE